LVVAVANGNAGRAAGLNQSAIACFESTRINPNQPEPAARAGKV